MDTGQPSGAGDDRRLPVVLLAAFFFLVPLDEHPLVGVVSVSDLLLVAMALYAAAAVYRRGRIEVGRAGAATLLGLAVLAAARWLPVLSGGTTGRHLKFVATGLLVVVLHASLLVLCRSRRRVHVAVRAIWLSAVVVSALNVAQGYELLTLPGGLSRFGPGRSVLGVAIPVARRGTAVFSPFAALGAWSILGAVFAVASLCSGRILRRRVAALSLPVLLVNATLVLQSRAVWLGTAVGLGTTVWLLSYRYRAGYRTVVRPAGALLLASSPVVLPAAVRGLVAIRERTVENRIAQYRAALDLLVANPLFGVDAGSVKAAVGYGLHSVYVQLLAFNTVVGLGAFGYVLGTNAAGYVRRVRAREAAAEEIAFVGGAAGVLVTVAFFPSASSYVLWGLLSLSSIYHDLSVRAG